MPCCCREFLVPLRQEDLPQSRPRRHWIDQGEAFNWPPVWDLQWWDAWGPPLHAGVVDCSLPALPHPRLFNGGSRYLLGLCRRKLQRIGQSDKAHSDRHVHHANVATVVPIQRDATAWQFSSKLETKENQLLPSVGAFRNRNIQKKITSQKTGERHSKRSNALPSTTRKVARGFVCFNPCCPTCCPPTVHPAPMHKGKAVGSRKPRNARSQLTCRSAASCGLSHCHSQPHKPETKHHMLCRRLFIAIYLAKVRKQVWSAIIPSDEGITLLLEPAAVHTNVRWNCAAMKLLVCNDAVVLPSQDTKNPL